MDLEARLRRFGAWRTAVWTVAASALAAVAAWAVTTFDAQSPAGALLAVGSAAVLGSMTIAVAASLVRVRAGVLACRAGLWTFAPDAGPVRSGALEVTLDLGGFLLLRIGDRRWASTWLPVQRAGLEREWHALRCAVYSPPPVAGASLRRAHPTPE